MAKRKQVSFGRAKRIKQSQIKKEKADIVDNSILKRYCPFFKTKCKGLNCAFGEEKDQYIYLYSSEKVLYCKLFEGLTGRLKFDIETRVKQEER